ncbi:hypothetical protein HRbin36_00876 [bacterium HR36]|nr:hypothetical protein HRbin36_00876 [bacterium HR36]
MVAKSLDIKLAQLHADPHRCRAFILADAKDADMAFGIGAPGRSPENYTGEVRFRTLAEWRDIITEIVEQGLVDIMLMSASTNEVLTIQRRIFDQSSVTPAVRVNDTTDIYIVRGGKYAQYPSLPFRSATLDHIQCGHLDCTAEERHLGANLGLYSITFNNDPVLDREALQEYKAFRLEAERKGFRHFLEVFDPNKPEAVAASCLPQFVNDMIVRSLAGVTSAGRPLFLKIVYHGPQAMEELVRYDPHLIVGILGGSAGTTYDAFKLLAEAKKHGARVALFGRKINNAENQLAFIRFLRLVADEEISPEEAVRAYHGVLQRLGIKPHRSLAEDMQLTRNIMSYAGTGRVISLPPGVASTRTYAVREQESAGNGNCQCPNCPCQRNQLSDSGSHTDARPNGSAANGPEPDFRKMTPAEKVAYNLAKWRRILG